MPSDQSVIFSGESLGAEGNDAVAVVVVEEVDKLLLVDGERSVLPQVGSHHFRQRKADRSHLREAWIVGFLHTSGPR